MSFGLKQVGSGIFNMAYFSSDEIEYYLGGLLADMIDPIYLDPLIQSVSAVLNGQENEFDGETPHTHLFTVGTSNTDIFELDITLPGLKGSTPDLTIPTVDFRDILAEWKKFLEKSIDDTKLPYNHI